MSLAALAIAATALWAHSHADYVSVGDRQASAAASPSSTTRLYPVPRAISIPALNVDTRVLPVGLDPARAVDIPHDIRLVGWYRLGVPPGADRGSAVIVGHRDGREQGHGVFYRLGELTVGDRVLITTANRTALPYRVVAREFISKKRLPITELFAVTGSPRLTLISCGGYYDRANGGYQDNIVVTAVRA